MKKKIFSEKTYDLEKLFLQLIILKESIGTAIINAGCAIYR